MKCLGTEIRAQTMIRQPHRFYSTMSKAHMLVTLSFLAIFQSSDASICLREPRCYCNTKSSSTEIYCKDVIDLSRDLSKVEAMSSNFSHIYSMRIHGLDNAIIDRPIFKGQNIIVLAISGTVANISDEALSSIQGLQIVNFYGSQFSSVPQVFASPNLKTVQLVHGSLDSIDDVLQNNTMATDFLFNDNRISTVSPTAFLNVKYLAYLNLSNNQLSSLDPAVFRNSILKSVDLSYNRLHSVDGYFQYLDLLELNLYGNNLSSLENVFHPSMNMKWLNLGGNPNLIVNSSTFQDYMKNLLELNLSDNHFNELDFDILKSFSILYTLLLNGNNFSYLPPNFLKYTHHLSTIDLGDNNLTSVDALFPVNDNEFKIYSLKTVRLYGNNLQSMKFGASAKSVLHLDLCRNSFSAIRSTDLENLTSVTSLNFSGNPLNQLEAFCFRNQKLLRSLDLSSTELTTLNRTIQNLSDLDQLTIDSSSLIVIDETEFQNLDALKILSLRNNNLSSVHGAMRSLTNLTTLDVSINNLTTLTADSFPPSGENKLKKLWMADNPWSCDCRISWLLDWLKKKGSILEDNPLCQTPIQLQGKPIRSLNLTDLELWQEDCPSSCDCKCIPEGSEAYTSVNCTSRNLTKTPEDFSRNSMEVYLSDNHIAQFDGFGSIRMPSLRLLDLENNELSSVKLNLPPSVTALKLAGNRLSRFPTKDWRLDAVKSVTLSRNPWICDCDAWDFVQWMMSQNSTVEDIMEIRCDKDGGFSNEMMIRLTRDQLCPSANFKTILIAVICSCFILMCICCWIFRKSLAALLYSCCSCVKARDKYEYSFDAFLLYADEDEDFALGTIAEGLERRSYGFKLFIPTRQVLLSTEAVNMESSLNDCSKIVVILTRAFLRNDQCMQLLKASISCSLNNSSRRLIFVTKGGLSGEELDPILGAVVKKSARLKWGEFLFWQKLRYSLPRRNERLLRDDGYEPLIQNPDY